MPRLTRNTDLVLNLVPDVIGCGSDDQRETGLFAKRRVCKAVLVSCHDNQIKSPWNMQVFSLLYNIFFSEISFLVFAIVITN